MNPNELANQFDAALRSLQEELQALNDLQDEKCQRLVELKTLLYRSSMTVSPKELQEPLRESLSESLESREAELMELVIRTDSTEKKIVALHVKAASHGVTLSTTDNTDRTNVNQIGDHK